MIFSFRSRRRICERGYDATRRDLLRRSPELAPVFTSHGFTLRTDILADESRDLWKSAGLEAQRPRTVPAPAATASLNRALRQLEQAQAPK